MASMLETVAAQPGDKIKELVTDAVALLNAERIDNTAPHVVMWRIPGDTRSYGTESLVLLAISKAGKALSE